jgi:hypothetical protein
MRCGLHASIHPARTVTRIGHSGTVYARSHPPAAPPLTLHGTPLCHTPCSHSRRARGTPQCARSCNASSTPVRWVKPLKPISPPRLTHRLRMPHATHPTYHPTNQTTACVHLLIHSYTYTLIHKRTHTPTHSRSRSRFASCIHSCIHTPIPPQTLTPSYTPTPTHSYTYTPRQQHPPPWVPPRAEMHLTPHHNNTRQHNNTQQPFCLTLPSKPLHLTFQPTHFTTPQRTP